MPTFDDQTTTRSRSWCSAWRLEALDGDTGTRIAVHVEIPEAEARRLDDQRAAIAASLRALAATAARPARG